MSSTPPEPTNPVSKWTKSDISRLKKETLELDAMIKGDFIPLGDQFRTIANINLQTIQQDGKDAILKRLSSALGNMSAAKNKLRKWRYLHDIDSEEFKPLIESDPGSKGNKFYGMVGWEPPDAAVRAIAQCVSVIESLPSPVTSASLVAVDSNFQQCSSQLVIARERFDGWVASMSQSVKLENAKLGAALPLAPD